MEDCAEYGLPGQQRGQHCNRDRCGRGKQTGKTGQMVVHGLHAHETLLSAMFVNKMDWEGANLGGINPVLMQLPLYLVYS